MIVEHQPQPDWFFRWRFKASWLGLALSSSLSVMIDYD